MVEESTSARKIVRTSLVALLLISMGSFANARTFLLVSSDVRNNDKEYKEYRTPLFKIWRSKDDCIKAVCRVRIFYGPASVMLDGAEEFYGGKYVYVSDEIRRDGAVVFFCEDEEALNCKSLLVSVNEIRILED